MGLVLQIVSLNQTKVERNTIIEVRAGPFKFLLYLETHEILAKFHFSESA